MTISLFVLRCLLFLFGLVWIVSITEAKEAIGKVVKLKGLVYKKFQEQEMIKRLFKNEHFLVRNEFEKKHKVEGLHEGALLYAGDEVFTDENSIVKFKLKDETFITLGPQSEFQIKNYVMTQNDREAFFFHNRGMMRMKVNQPVKQGSLKVKLPHLSMGIRGTEFISEVYDNDRNHIGLIEGKLDVYLKNEILPMKENEVLHYDDFSQKAEIFHFKKIDQDNFDEYLLDRVSLASIKKEQQDSPLKIKTNEESLPNLKSKKKNWQDLLQGQQNLH